MVDFGALHPANEGFLTGKGTDNAIHTVLNLWEDAKNNHKACYNIMYDVSGAYDNLSHETIERGLDILHIPKKTKAFILNKLKNSTYAIKTAYGNTEPFAIKRGCPQGCPLSPIIYIIAMNPLHVGLETNPLKKFKGKKDGYVIASRTSKEHMIIGSKGYADDTLVISASEKGRDRMAKWVNEFCIVNRISMNKSKTRVFGRDDKGLDSKKAVDIIQQTTREERGGSGTRQGAWYKKCRVIPAVVGKTTLNTSDYG